VTEELEVWLIGWCPGQSTPLHDHGGAEGALVVVAGALDETIVLPPPAAAHRRSLRPGRAVRLPASRVHRVGNAGSVLATSIHAYSPPGCASLAAVTLRRLGLCTPPTSPAAFGRGGGADSPSSVTPAAATARS
jgi:predicted metal-dependent enzyme (double-stranded beta helix superfamily)